MKLARHRHPKCKASLRKIAAALEGNSPTIDIDRAKTLLLEP